MRDSDWLVVLIVQERRNSIANALELCLSCAKPSNYGIFVARKNVTDHPEKIRTTQTFTMGGPLGDPGFCFLCSTVYGGDLD